MPSDPVQHVLDRLEALDCRPRGGEERGWDARCPAHEDRNPSLHLAQGDDGRALIVCYRGCALDEIAAALQIPVPDLFEPNDDQPVKREVVKRYDYQNAIGKLLFQVERMVPKGFRQRRPDGAGGWIYDRKGIVPVLYNLPAVLAAEQVVIVEGEKDADALIARGVVATTCPGGAGKWRDDYGSLFVGKKVAIIQDVDPQDPKTGHYPGQEHAQAVRDSLQRAGVTATMLQPAVGKDVSEHLAAGMKLGALLPATEGRQVSPRMEVLSARQIMALPDPDTDGYLLGPLIYRGHRIVVGGWTGHGKTTFTMHMVASAVEGTEFLRPKWKGKGGLRALVVDVEQGTRTVKRVLREVGLDRSDNVKYLRVPDGLALDSDADAIAFMEKEFAKGRYDIVLCDPLYKCHRGDPNDSQAATELMRRFDDWRDRYQFALLLPMHCRKPQGGHGAPKLSPHDLFGSSTYQWGAEMLLGVERKSPGMTWVHWWKDREGDAAEDGATVGNHWDVHFDRKRGGYQRYVENNQGRLDLGGTTPTPQFDLRKFCYELIRDDGPVSPTTVSTRLHHEGRNYKASAIEEALENIGHLGVMSDGVKPKKNRTYYLQPSLLNSQNSVADGHPQ